MDARVGLEGFEGRSSSAKKPGLRGMPALLALAELGCSSQTSFIEKRQTLAKQGAKATRAFAVVSGMLRAVYRAPDGTRQITRFLLPGDAFGLDLAQAYDRSLEAITDAQVQEYDRRSLETIIAEDPKAAGMLLNLLSKVLSQAKSYQALLGRGSAKARLARFLLDMADRQGEPGSKRKNTIVRLPMDRMQIANHLCLRHETVCRRLAELIDRGVVGRLDLHTVVLLDRQALESES